MSGPGIEGFQTIWLFPSDSKTSRTARKQNAIVWASSDSLSPVALILVWCQQIVVIQPLNIVTLCVGQRFVSGCRAARIGLIENLHRIRFKGPCYFSSIVSGTIVNHNDFLPWPCLIEC